MRSFIWISFIAILLFITDGNGQEAISMTSDGWRPIFGAKANYPAQREEIKYYRNPIQNSETVKAETPVSSTTPIPTTSTTTTTTKPTTTTPKPTEKVDNKPPAVKIIAHHSKNHYFVVPNGVHGPHIPLNAIPFGRPGHMNQYKKFGHMNKQLYNKPFSVYTVKRPAKPHQHHKLQTAQSNRQEVYVPAPKNTPGLQYYQQQHQPKQSLVKTRQTSDLGLPGGKPIRISHPHGHISYSHHFPLGPPNQNYFRFGNPIQSYQHFGKVPRPSETSFQVKDEYTRNLVPPPTFQTIQSTRVSSSSPATEPIPVTREIQKTTTEAAVPAPLRSGNSFLPSQQVEVTKEKLNVYHNEVPLSYSPQTEQYFDFDYHALRTPSSLRKNPSYEVTEGDYQQDIQPFYYNFQEPQQIVTTQRSTKRPRPAQVSTVELNVPSFLPTPYKPDRTIPTSPTQKEVSSIYGHLSNVKNPDYHSFFDVKEVSTHYPIVGKPLFDFEYIETTTYRPENDIINDITTYKRRPAPAPAPVPSVTTFRSQKRPTSGANQRLPNRRRRPTTTTSTTTSTSTSTTTESYTTLREDFGKIEENLTDESIEREQTTERIRKPYRTTTQAPVYEESNEAPRIRNRNRNRYNNQKINSNRHKINRIHYRDDETSEDLDDKSYDNYRNHNKNKDDKEIYEHENRDNNFSSSRRRPSKENINTDYELPERNQKVDSEEKYETTSTRGNSHTFTSGSEETDSVEVTELSKIETTEQTPTAASYRDNSNEIDSTTKSIFDNLKLIYEDYTTEKETTTTTPTTTTTQATTTPTKSHRIRKRPPIKYDVSNRPRFSVKEYRQRLTQHTSTTTEPSASPSSRSTPNPTRTRIANRSRKPQHTTYASITSQNEETSADKYRGRFKPKDPRHGLTSEIPLIITEKNIKPVNTNLRPFGGRHKTTTESSVPVSKVTIRPNLFARRTRPPLLNLKNRIAQKNNSMDTSRIDNDQTTLVSNANVMDLTTTTSVEVTQKDPISSNEGDSDDASNDDYSQRVSDLTSSAKKEYDTPGMFKSVAPISRRIPNYFTLQTDDPILPIEAFFPNLKEKESDE